MSNNIRKFDSTAQYQKYRNTDGWAYPAVNVVSNGIETQTHYNNELRMRWSTTDTTIVPTFSGDISLADFKTWVDNASYPCEIKKDGTDFAYIKRSTGSSVADWTLRSDNSASHYNTDDKTNYLQMTEIENVNVGLFENTAEHWQEVRFNFDKGCPEGFHKWFAHPYWNASRGKYTKLIGRYNSTPAGTNTSDTAAGINCAFGLSQGGTKYDNYTLGNWTANLLLAATKATNANLLEETYWEHVVLSYIFSAYYGTFNHQSIFYGHATDYNTAENPKTPTGAGAGAGLNGHTDSLLVPHGTKVSNPSTTNGGYRFMHIENAIHGQQWIWGAGWGGNNGKYYMTYDDIKANASATFIASNADVVGTYPTTLDNSYFGNADLWGVPTNTSGGSSSTRYCDAAWSNTGSDRVAYLGGRSVLGSSVGGFARAFDAVAGASAWDWRGRSTMNR